MEIAPDLGERLLDALHSVHGEHAGHRGAHAKGSCCTATFTATAEGAALTRAPHFQGAPVAATVRFSNGSGIPTLPDYARSDGRGIAVKFDLPGGGHADMVALSLPVFFVRDPESFIDFLRVTRPDPETRQPNLALVGEFLERHPETQAALGAAMAPDLPGSYLAVRYNGIHAFRLVDTHGAGRWVRYRWEPRGGESRLTPAEARALGRDYLQEDLRKRLEAGHSTFDLVFILADEGDSLVDPTAPWPEDRHTVVGGRLEITARAAEDCDRMVFDPTNVPDGIELSEDPILHARSAAYAASFAARRGISGPPASPVHHADDAGARAVVLAGALAPGEMRAVEVDGARVAVARVGETVVAFQDACTHRGCSLADGKLEGTTVTCPCHGSRFDLTTGAVLQGPAKEPISLLA